MNYLPRPGIVQASICNMNVLVPSREAADVCHTILPLTLLGTFIWSGIQKDLPIEKVLEVCRIFSKKSDEELTERIETFCRTLCEKGFAIPRETESDPAAGR